jgi:hypothetical protein
MRDPRLDGGPDFVQSELHYESDRAPRAVSQLVSTEAEVLLVFL